MKTFHWNNEVSAEKNMPFIYRYWGVCCCMIHNSSVIKNTHISSDIKLTHICSQRDTFKIYCTRFNIKHNGTHQHVALETLPGHYLVRTQTLNDMKWIVFIVWYCDILYSMSPLQTINRLWCHTIARLYMTKCLIECQCHLPNI